MGHRGGPGALDKTHTPMNKQTVVPRPPGSTGPFLEISALNCKITLTKCSVKPQRARAQWTLPEGHWVLAR